MKKSAISNTEWGLFIGALIAIDLVQVGLDLLIIGLVLNPGIDIIVGMSIPFYLKIRGEEIGDAKSIGTFIGTFLLKLIPGVDDLPLWTLDGIIFMFKSKSNEIIGNIPGAESTLGTGKK